MWPFGTPNIAKLAARGRETAAAKEKADRARRKRAWEAEQREIDAEVAAGERCSKCRERNADCDCLYESYRSGH